MEFLIGNTPLVLLEEYKGRKIYAKLEYYNPTGSIKDRAAYNMIKSALSKNKLEKNGTVVECTSGNTGIGLAYVCLKMGLKCIITMPENMSKERIALMRAMGAKVILTKKELGMKGAKEEAERLSKEEKYYLINQFENEDNLDAHYKSTAPEIFNQLSSVDTIISPFGTGGTAMGIAKYIKENSKNTKVIGVEPEESPLITKNIVGPHQIAGIGANFVPKIFNLKDLEKVITIKSEEAKDGARYLLKHFGIMSGISGGASYMGTKKIIDEGYKSENIVIIIPDTGLRYISVGLYE